MITRITFIPEWLFLTLQYLVIWLVQVERHLNLKSVNELIYKKGLAKDNKQIFPLTDNNIIEQVYELFFMGLLV